jgi:hypothetical protein
MNLELVLKLIHVLLFIGRDERLTSNADLEEDWIKTIK